MLLRIRSVQIIPGKITVYEDRSFTFVLKTPPAAELLRKAAGVDKGAGNPLTTKGWLCNQGTGTRNR